MKITEANVEAVKRNAEAAIVNESITRKRVEALEAVLRRGFLGRLRWLFLGR